MKTCRLLSHRSLRPSAQIPSDSGIAWGGPQVCKQKAVPSTAIPLQWRCGAAICSQDHLCWQCGRTEGGWERRRESLSMHFSLSLSWLLPVANWSAPSILNQGTAQWGSEGGRERERDNQSTPKENQDMTIKYMQHINCFLTVAWYWPEWIAVDESEGGSVAQNTKSISLSKSDLPWVISWHTSFLKSNTG